MARKFDTQSTEEIIVPGPASAKSEPQANIDLTALRGAYAATDVGFGEPAPKSQDTLNEDLTKRAEQVREDSESGKSFSIGLYDIDEALGYYFRNVIKPTIVENNQVIPVDVIYGDPERWAVMQKFGYYRDNKGKLMLPLIMYRKTNVSKNDALIFPRVDVTQMNYISKKKWNIQNRYDKFSLLMPKKSLPDKYDITAIANHIIVEYECLIWTAFIAQTNDIIEKINFSNGAYWGDKDKYKFRTILESYSTANELTTDTERMIKCNFNLTVYGYILPEQFDNRKTTQRAIAPKKVVFSIQESMK